MKFLRDEESSDGKTRYVFALGRSEALILLRLLQKAVQYMPRIFETKSTQARMNDMRNVIRKAIPDMPKQDDGDYSEKNYENL